MCTSGTGSGADWYRNLQAGGLQALWVGSRRHRASVRFLEVTEAADVMGAYERAHPKTARKLYSMMGVSYDGTDVGRVEMMANIPMVAFRPEDDLASPLPTFPDLACNPDHELRKATAGGFCPKSFAQLGELERRRRWIRRSLGL